MRTPQLFACACLLAVLTFSVRSQEVRTVDSSISEVTVYLDRARVTRTASIDLMAGATVVQFTGLPVALDENSIEVDAKSGAQLSIQGIDLRQEILSASASPKVQDLENQLQQLQDQKKSLQAQKAVLDQKRSFLRNLSVGLGKSEKGSLNFDEIRQLYSFYGEEVSNLSQSILSLEAAEQRLEPELDKVRRELQNLRSGSAKAQRTVVVRVKSNIPSKADFTLRYGIAGASWNPSYDARIDSATGQAELICNAMVRQRTGEDWKNVRLALSTTEPSRNGQMPELVPFYLMFESEIPRATPAPAPPAMAPKAEMRATPGPEKSLANEAEPAAAELRINGMSVSFAVGLPVTIPSDGEPHRTNLTVLNLQGSPSYVCTPKLDPAAFFKLHVTNGSETPLLPGQVSVFRDGELIGTLALSLVPAGSEFDLYAGRDDAIKVERKELVNRRSETGLLSRKEVEEFKYQINLQSFRSAPIKLLLYDQLPVSKNAEIVVNQGTFSDKTASMDKETGKLSWEMELKPKEKKVVEFNFTVEWPKGKEIVPQALTNNAANAPSR